ncbi:GNAT family N-acetyltransferase [Flagellimonas onchidii]|uniref:GNAT family N-acetyltransferase n=1 Tax=Flagellimonas onchidii TaxID=2562684 RepID=UPI0010A5AF9C|nr:GNAT family N-acetyltransferase [Allomuricauda onchidii]
MELYLQQCTLSDLDLLVKISLETFAAAFEKHNDPRDFSDYVTSAFNNHKLSAEIQNPNSWFYFVKHNEETIGYIKLNRGEAQSDIKDDKSLELERIYVLQPYQGKGIGRWILEQIRQLALKQRVDFIWLGVWEKNEAAIRFYQKHGFTKFGAHPYYIGKDKQTDWLMRSDL